MDRDSIGFIGAGNMAHAMIRGILAANLVEPRQIALVNKSDEAKIAALCSKYGVRRAKNLQDLVRSSETVILAVKPSQVPEVLEELSAGAAVPPGVELSEPSVSRSRLLVSVAAGVPLEYLESALEHEFAVIRSMPNIPAQVGRGVMAATPGKGVTEKQKLAAERILGSTGKVFWVSEDDLDSVTALSGSGPAYFFRLAEDMAVAGAKLGLDPSLSEELARQTLAGAGALVAEKPVPLSQLVRDVTSPNGTTAAAMSVFDGRRLDLLVEEAMAHAAARSREMAQAPSRHSISGAARVVVKIGSSTVTDATGGLNLPVLAEVVRQIAELMSLGREVILVSSGAVAAGRGKMGDCAEGSIADKQVLSAVGQAVLMQTYETLFGEHGISIAQVLLTKDDFSSAKRAAICKNTLNRLCGRRIVPIINENDAVSFDEIRLGDNDTLSARVAVLLEAGALVILTDTDGLFSADPRRDPDARLLRTVARVDGTVTALAGVTGGPVGTGGMMTKLWAAEMATAHGIPVVIANGSKADVLVRSLSGQEVGTFFTPSIPSAALSAGAEPALPQLGKEASPTWKN
ncbi:MAG: glutamate 5-kinase [Bacillota bacterium]|jgi:glutamate 5-kinase